MTVEALDDLDTQRPGAIAAALSPTDPEPPLGAVVSGRASTLERGDVLACVEREVAQCEAEYLGAVRQGRLTADCARQEVGQMKATAIIRRAIQEKGLDVRQETLF